MNKQRKVLLILVVGAIALFAFLTIGLRHNTHEMAAREKLDSLLGQADETLPDETGPFTPYPSAPPAPSTGNSTQNPPGFMGLPIPNPMPGGMPDSGVSVEESPQAYVIHVPLVNPADAHNVKVNVTPHHIEVSGNIGRREQNVTFSSSFVQSFSTSQTVLPEKMTQKTVKIGTQTELVITVPKKPGNQSNLAPPPAPEAPIAPKSSDEPLPENDNTEHRVI